LKKKEGSARKRSLYFLTYEHVFYRNLTKRLRKTTKDIRPLGLESELGPLEMERAALIMKYKYDRDVWDVRSSPRESACIDENRNKSRKVLQRQWQVPLMQDQN
jgi:hypothetical protein